MRNRIFISVSILALAGLTAVAGFAEKQYAGEEIWPYHSSVVRRQAVNGLGTADVAMEDVEAVLRDVLKNRDEKSEIRLTALDSLRESDVRIDVMAPVLLDLVESSEEPDVIRLKALDTLLESDFAREKLEPVLVTIMMRSGEAETVRLEAVNILSEQERPAEEMISALQEVIRDTEETEALRLRALDSLLRLGVAEEDIAPALLSSLRDAEDEEAVRMAVLLSLTFYRDTAGEQTFPRVELARLLLNLLTGSGQIEETRAAALELLRGVKLKEEYTPLSSVLAAVLKDAENTDPIRRAVLEGTGFSEVTAENIDDDAENPYPETREEIDRYREFVIEKYHQSVSAYPETVTEISSLRELSEYAGKSGVNVRMKPGIYEVTVDNYEELLDEAADGRKALFLFSGTNSLFDLQGVEIKTDTRIPSFFDPHYSEVLVNGDNLIIEGLTITNVGNHRERGTGHVQPVSVDGDNNLFYGLRIYTRGSYPYGYTCGLTADRGWGVSGAAKRGGLGAGGQNNAYVDVEVYQRASGHALAWWGEVNNTFIDCHIEGEVRSTDAILRRTEGGFYTDMDSLPEEDARKIRDNLEPGRMMQLCEDAFRSYDASGKLKILGCTVKNVRDAVKRGNYDTLFISNTSFSGVIGGPLWFEMDGDARVVNSEVNLGCGMLVRLFRAPGAEVDITVNPNPFEFLPRWSVLRRRSGRMFERDITLTLRAGEDLDVEKVKEERGEYPLEVHSSGHFIRNETGLPILLTEESRNCRVITNGEVIDNGENNQIKYMD